MAGIGEFAYGFDANGVDQYLDNIKADYLLKAKEALSDIDVIKNICENNWEGQSRDAFLFNLRADEKHVENQLDILYDILVKEVNAIKDAMAEKDATLIESDIGGMMHSIGQGIGRVESKILGGVGSALGDALVSDVTGKIDAVKTGAEAYGGYASGVFDGLKH